MTHWRQHLVRRLAQPLPGDVAHLPLAPSHTRAQRLFGPRADARPSAVTALLFDDGTGRPMLPLIVRSGKLAVHRGQICLPGGSMDPGETPWQTALRELEEELGIAPGEVEPLGALSPVYIPVSGFLIHPFVARIAGKPEYRPNRHEVDEVLELPIEIFVGHTHVRTEIQQRDFGPTEVPYFPAGAHKVWGATAMILGELGALFPID